MQSFAAYLWHVAHAGRTDNKWSLDELQQILSFLSLVRQG
jgi:hypothetical protein